ncbi:hypothetical protein [Sinorhizobium alkalisoli]|uniref:hypothetical protein n=1 Tax=Sinorhizobium alkalisoli TaxID=1752398 RepID=UPI00124EBD0B|nr:hypothetical protein [Sinorhizobium alkalisoli]QFI67972.1 hypothetical protein EKH55_3098 [Sinorhizobium alkalisoli]
MTSAAIPAIETICERASRAIMHRIAVNKKADELNSDTVIGDDGIAQLHAAVRSYRKQLRALHNAVQSGKPRQVSEAKKRIFDSFAAKLIATVRATQDNKIHLSYAQLEKRANNLSLHQVFHETLTIFPDPKCGKPGEWRPLGRPGQYRRAQQLILCDVLLVMIGDSPCDSTVADAGGEIGLFETLNSAIAEGFVYWTSLDLRNFFPSLKPGHLAGFPLSQWIMENIVFLPPETPIKFIDTTYGLELTEETVLKGDANDLPKTYPYSMDDIRSKLKMVRQGLIQGDVCAPQIARTFLGRELQRVLGKRDAAFGSHIDDMLLGACTQPEAKTSLKALIQHLKCHPAGPLELHEHEIRHINDDICYLGYRISLDKNGAMRVRPAMKRFDRFRHRLGDKFENSDAFTKQELLDTGLEYARQWFRSQRAWTKAEIGIGSSKCEGPSWDHVVSEVELAVNRFIYDEYFKGIGNWHDGDIDFEMLKLAGCVDDLQ